MILFYVETTAKPLSLLMLKGAGQQTTQLNESVSEFLKDIPAATGTDLHTTIDLDLQKAAYEAFEKHGRVGSLVAMSPQGEILAWISHPAFDPNKFSKGVSSKVWRQWLNSPHRPLGNKVIQEHYPPGSTYKPFVALGALQENLISANKFLNSPAKIKIGRRCFP